MLWKIIPSKAIKGYLANMVWMVDQALSTELEIIKIQLYEHNNHY